MSILKKLFGQNGANQSPKITSTKEVKSSGRNTDACPFCGTVFSPAPKRKKVCPECKNEVFVRTTQEIFDSDLLSKEDTLAADFYSDLMYQGATLEDYKKMEAALQAKWGFKPKSYDIVWGVSNRLITKPIASDVYDKSTEILQRAKMIGLSQALFQAKRGKDPAGYKQTVNNYDIQMAQRSGLPLKSISIQAHGCCDECEKYNGKEYSPQQLKQTPILPIKTCTNKLNPTDKFAWCICWYSPEYKSLTLKSVEYY